VDTDRDCRVGYSGRAVRTLVDDLDAFYLEHRCCGRLEADVENRRVWMTCECGAAIAEPIGTGVMSLTLPIATPLSWRRLQRPRPGPDQALFA